MAPLNTFGQDISTAGGSIVPSGAPTITPNPSGSLAGTMTTAQPPTSTTPPVVAPTAQTQTPASTQTQSPPASTTPGAGLDPTSFSNVINGVKQNFANNNDLINAKNLLVKGLFTSPLTSDQIAQLPPDIQQVYNAGNKDAIELQIQALNERIQGGTNNFASSVNYLVNGYNTSVTQAEQQKQDALDTLFKISQNFVNPQTGTVDLSKMGNALQALYPGIDTSGIISELNGLMPTSTYTSTAHYGTSNLPGGGDYSVVIPSGTIASSTNNPLNIKYVDGNEYGATDSGISAQDGGSFASFQSPSAGLDAAIQLLQSPTYADLTVDQAMKKWSNSGYGAEVSPSLNASQKISSLSQPQIQQLVTDMAKRESGATVETSQTVDINPPDASTGDNKNAGIAAGTNNTPNGIYQAALDYMFTGKMPSLGVGSTPSVINTKTQILALAGGMAQAAGTDLPNLQALYKANSSAATQNVQRLARVDSVLNATQLNFPRLEQLAQTLKQNGINLTESDLQAGSAAVQQKFGSPDAAAYTELINTIRSDYSAAQAALAGSRGGQFFAEGAAQAIPAGLTPDQYEAIKNTLTLSSNNASTAINDEVNSLLDTNGILSNGGTNSTPTSSSSSPSDSDPLNLGI